MIYNADIADKEGGASMENANERSPFLTPAEAAKIARLDLRTMHGLCQQGKVKAVKVGWQWRIYRDEFMKMLGLDS